MGNITVMTGLQCHQLEKLKKIKYLNECIGLKTQEQENEQLWYIKRLKETYENYATMFFETNSILIPIIRKKVHQSRL